MKSLTLYLFFDGNCEEAFEFYEKVFDAKIVSLIKYDVFPEGEGWPVLSEADRGNVENVVLRITHDIYLQGADRLVRQEVRPGNNMSVYLSLDSKEEAERIFSRLSEGGVVNMPLTEVHWNALFGICIDKYSIEWLVDYTYPTA